MPLVGNALLTRKLPRDRPGPVPERCGRWSIVPLAFLLSLNADPREGTSVATVLVDYQMEEFVVHSGPVALTVRVVSPPPERLAAQPRLLLFFSTDRAASMPDGRHGAATRLFVEAGHRVASFDLPAHGERVGEYGAGIAGWAAQWAAGDDPFTQLIVEGRRVIGECVRRGLAEGGVVVAGVSRGGYGALRLAAADERVTAVAAFAPVTDWRELREFAGARDDPRLEALALTAFAHHLVGRRVYVAIGSDDQRVGTPACLRFMLAVAESVRAIGPPDPTYTLHVVSDSLGHALATRWREEGIQFLLASTNPTPIP